MMLSLKKISNFLILTGFFHDLNMTEWQGSQISYSTNHKIQKIHKKRSKLNKHFIRLLVYRLYHSIYSLFHLRIISLTPTHKPMKLVLCHILFHEKINKISDISRKCISANMVRVGTTLIILAEMHCLLM